MCDDSWVRVYLGLAVFMMISAAGAVVVAAIANGSVIYLAYAAPGMLAAAASTVAAIGLLVAARTSINTFYNCRTSRGTIATCKGRRDSLASSITALTTVLGIQAVSATAIAANAYIPWVPQPSMWTLVATMFLQIAALISLLSFWSSLKECLNGLPSN